MRASRWEILGAWLRVWTPPRDVEIPPVPRRPATLLGAGVVAAAVAIVLLLVPALDRSKAREATTEQRRQAAATRAEVARLRFDQRAHSARAPSVARLYRAGRRAEAQAALERHAAASVTRDARARVASRRASSTRRCAACAAARAVASCRHACGCRALPSRRRRGTRRSGSRSSSALRCATGATPGVISTHPPPRARLASACSSRLPPRAAGRAACQTERS